MSRFIAILPDWRQLSVGLNAILLAPGGGRCYGWCDRGVVAVCAWSVVFWEEWCSEFFSKHQRLLERLGVPHEPADGGYHLCKFEPPTIRAFQLVHILMHEFGHHHDRMTTRSQRYSSRGERFAEEYAVTHEMLIWDRYVNEFGMP